MVYRKAVLSALLIAAFPTLPSELAFAQNNVAIEWQSPAQFRQLLKKSIKGTLLFDNDGIEFRAPSFRTAGRTGKSRLSISPGRRTRHYRLRESPLA